MKKIKLYIFLAIFILLLICSGKVNAAGSISLVANKSTINVGDEFTISVNLSGASVATLTTRVNVDTSKVDYVSGPSNSSFSNGRAIYTWTDPTGGDNPKTGGTIVTFKFRAKQTGKATFSVSGDFYSSDEKNVNPNFSGTSVTIQEKTTKPPATEGENSNSGNTNGQTTGNNTETNAGSNSGGTATGGNSNTNKPSTGGSNTGGTTSSLSSNANLKELHLDVEGLSPAFNKNTTNYNLVVTNNTSNIQINAIPEDSKAKVQITGNTNLNIGLNKIAVKVTAEDNKSTKTYTINVTKTDDPNLANANLENLAIENVTLSPEFNENILEYTTEVESSVENLNILAIPQIEGATVNIQGKDNLQFGENTITISVIAKDGITTKDYIIKLYKKTVEEEQADTALTNLEQESIDSNEGKNTINIGNIVFCVIIVICIGALIFIIIKKYIHENKK